MNELKKYLQGALLFPKEIHLESHSDCNAQCTICPREGMTRYKGIMNRDLFIKAIDECADYPDMEYIHFHLNGEPLLMNIHELCWRINYARMKCPQGEKGRPRLAFFTNGSLLSTEKSEKLMQTPINIIVISIDGGNKEDYEKIRRGLKWERLVENVRMLAIIRDAKKPSLKLQTAIIPQIDNFKSLDKYFALFRSFGIDDVGGSGVQNIGGLIDSESKIIHGNQYREGDNERPCWRIFLDLSIMADGRACVCCQDVRGMHVIGDLNTQSLKEIWLGKEMMEIRQKFIDGKKKEIRFCADCDYMKGVVLDSWWNIDNNFQTVYDEVCEEMGVIV
jgi:sulfatase maturation enzyme AslB (radical SAM superfamily)